MVRRLAEGTWHLLLSAFANGATNDDKDKRYEAK
jgi:hypothetical protein